MTAAHGYHTYYDIIQAYDLTDKRRVPPKEPTYKPNSVMGFLSAHDDFKLFTFLLKTARVDMIADQDQFFSTLFVCNDETMKKQLGEEFFMKLDRNTATKLVNVPPALRATTLRSTSQRNVIFRRHHGRDTPSHHDADRSRYICCL